MISRQERIRDLITKNRQRRNLESIVPKLRRILSDDLQETKLQIFGSSDFPEGLSQIKSTDFHYVWSFDDIEAIEDFCFDFAKAVGDLEIRLLIPELETGVLEISLETVSGNVKAFLETFNSLWFYEPRTSAEFEIAKHTYYYYGNNATAPKEYKWELDVKGFWSKIARQQLIVDFKS